ncbi:tRNA (cytosine(72)-C(5))-methyltransferase NSUN6 [Cydia splendana]|uniref:tRNA (cytosine(72)-C(5))-methyltransferase NSUN6 n=1 Tax=Cydia splendana TaxID=1100963 RepID=UPI0021248DB1
MELQTWLSQPPKYTTFRINKTREYNIKTFENYLEDQRESLKLASIPKFYCLYPDCLVVEQWLTDVQPSGNLEVIVDALCAVAVLRGAHVFAPGVMGLPPGCSINDKVDIYGDMEGKCKKGLKLAYTGQKVFVGTGYLKMLRHELFNDGIPPSGIAIEVALPASRLPVINESIYPKGTLVLQNLPSIVCGWVVNAQPKELILDMCASPGNKTTHLAEMCNNEATIIAIDKTPQKVARIKENCEKNGVTCVTAYAFDSTKCHSENGTTDVTKGPPFSSNVFDKILLDGPCSGLGQRPQLVNKMTDKMLQSYKFVQRKLMESAVKVLKVGGVLVYSTCTVTEEENEAIVAWALSKFPCLQLVPAEPLLGGPGMPCAALTDAQRAMLQRFGPEEDCLRPTKHPIYKDTIGFFIAKFVKTE